MKRFRFDSCSLKNVMTLRFNMACSASESPHPHLLPLLLSMLCASATAYTLAILSLAWEKSYMSSSTLWACSSMSSRFTVVSQASATVSPSPTSKTSAMDKCQQVLQNADIKAGGQ